jgi:hypothetical protein
MTTSANRLTPRVDLKCQHKNQENQALLVKGPEVMIRPVGICPQSVRGRFSADQLQAMIDLYKSGATAEQVAQTYGFNKPSIKRLLQQHGVGRERRDKRMISWMGRVPAEGQLCPRDHDGEQYRRATRVSAFTHDMCSAKVLTARVRVAPRVATTVEHRDPAAKEQYR